VVEVLREMDGRRLLRQALAFLPPAAAAFLFERPIEERLGNPRGVATAQVVAGVALALADLRPADRSHEDATELDALLIGVGQACALAPGVSRNGATLTAARLLRFDRRSANRLSRRAALPIILAAAGLKGHRLWHRGVPAGVVAGALAAFASTLLSSPLVGLVDGARSYKPFAGYRVGLGVVSLMRLNGAHGR
jgi:undecaprenyl-diphosphatase